MKNANINLIKDINTTGRATLEDLKRILFDRPKNVDDVINREVVEVLGVCLYRICAIHGMEYLANAIDRVIYHLASSKSLLEGSYDCTSIEGELHQILNAIREGFVLANVLSMDDSDEIKKSLLVLAMKH